jgi:hypothetical protein
LVLFLLNFVWRWAASEVDERGVEGCKVFLFFWVALVTFMLSSILFTAVVNLITPMEGVTKKKASFGTPFRAEQVSRSCCQRGSEWCGVLTGAAFIFGHG